MTLRSRTRKRRAEINIVPLVDVLMVLIFFFLMTMQFREPKVLNLELPSIETAGSSESRGDLRLIVDENGDLFLNEQSISADGLQKALSVAGEANPDRKVLLAVHEDTPVKTLTQVMDWSRKAGLSAIRIQSREAADGAAVDGDR
ncbi:ExbD/TolR family protein [Puniceicoccus vermicola]|uniref:Biopolymer transporter ExbD n=1 Tax=Puniceicoccus vermicola TaxID=388746 RepID=A0A7X1B3W6_9BACT|nr:biopolymer transporter ExbD [Puniceicoccus vermicola]MBC2604048.1 biopolymer transporter ExbD [Puniceicoccus vermicola]